MQVRKSKTTGKKRWEADLGKINGHRQRKFFPTRAQAEGYIQTKTREIENLGSQALVLTDHERAEYLAVKNELAKLDATLMDALKFYKVHHHAIKTATVREVADLFLKSVKDADRRKNYRTKVKVVLDAFCLHSPDKSCPEISAQGIHDWLHGQGWASETRKGYLTVLRTFFNFAVNHHYCKVNPADSVQRPTPEETPPRILTIEQIKTLLKAGLKHDPELTGGYIAPILFGGPRVSEAKALTSGEVTKEQMNIRSDRAKTRRRRLIEPTKQLRAWIKLCKVWPLKNVRRRLKALRDIAKIPWPRNCLRHSFCSYAIWICGAKETAAAAGHSEQVLFNRYYAPVLKKAADEWSKLVPKSFSKSQSVRGSRRSSQATESETCQQPAAPESDQ